MAKLNIIYIFVLFVFVNAQSNSKKDLLFSYAEHGNVHEILKIIATGADPNWRKEDDGQSALHVAAILNNVDVISVLLNANANINLQDDYGFSPLFVASTMKQSTDAVKLFINRGADINLPSDRGQTPLMNAAQSGNWDNVRALIKGNADVTLSAKDGYTALHSAIEIGPDSNIIRLLLNKGADPKKKTKWGATPADMARELGHPDIANIIDTFTPTPKPPTSGKFVFDATMRGDLAEVKKGLATGTDPNWIEWRTPDSNIWTFLHAASRYNRPAIVSTLLEAGADKDLQDNRGRTALHVASQYNYPAVMELLLDVGADMNLPDKYDLTPLYLASMAGSTEAVTMLIDYGVDIDFLNHFGRTALHAASASNHPAVVTVLIDAGADINIQDNVGQTPIHKAAIKNSVDAARILMLRGANKRMQDSKGWTPGKIARKLRYNEMANIINRARA